MKHTIKGYIVHQVWADNPRGPATFRFTEYEPTNSCDIWIQTLVCKHEMEVEIPDDFDPRQGQIVALEAQKKELRAKFAASVKDIDDRINSLLALEMS